MSLSSWKASFKIWFSRDCKRWTDKRVTISPITTVSNVATLSTSALKSFKITSGYQAIQTSLTINAQHLLSKSQLNFQFNFYVFRFLTYLHTISFLQHNPHTFLIPWLTSPSYRSNSSCSFSSPCSSQIFLSF